MVLYGMKTSKLIAFLTLLSLLLNFSAATIEAKNTLSIKKNNDNLEVFLNGVSEPLIIQNAKDGFRPYLHPIKGPNGNGVFTQYSPGHHKHQTGLYWGLTRVNGRDYFHNPSSKYWRKKSSNIINNSGDNVVWETIYEMLNNEGEALMTETQSWSMSVSKRGEIILDLVWKGYANEKLQYQNITTVVFFYECLGNEISKQKLSTQRVIKIRQERAKALIGLI